VAIRSEKRCFAKVSVIRLTQTKTGMNATDANNRTLKPGHDLFDDATINRVAQRQG
jgi:hypothetical protein